MPSFRVTYRVVVQAESSDEAIAEAAKAAESGGLSEPGVRADVAVERDPIRRRLRLRGGRCPAEAPEDRELTGASPIVRH